MSLGIVILGYHFVGKWNSWHKHFRLEEPVGSQWESHDLSGRERWLVADTLYLRCRLN